MSLKFSVITPSYNQGEFIEATIRSVLDQNYPNFEHIVIDGGSTDCTIEVLKKYSHLKWISGPDRGQSHAINKGFAMASGDVIAWINSDDHYLPNAFWEVTAEIEKNPIVYGDFLDIREDRTLIRTYEAPSKISKKDLIRWWSGDRFIAQPATFFRRSVLDRVGGVDESLHFSMDTDLWIRMSEHFSFHYLPTPLVARCRQQNSKTIARRDDHFREALKTSQRYWGDRFSIEYLRHFFSYLGSVPRLYRNLSGFFLKYDRRKALKYLLLSVMIFPPKLLERRTISIFFRLIRSLIKQDF